MTSKKKLKINKNLKIYIAGHGGMVGSSVLNYFKNKNFRKLIIISSKKLDLTKKELVFNFFKKNKPDIVINCAAKVGGIKINNLKKVSFFNSNLEISQNIINASYKFNIKRLIFLGSSCVYPNDFSKKIKEEDILSSSLEPTNEAYALAKISGIRLCHYYNEEFNRDFRCLMPPNLYGKNDNYDLNNSHVLAALIKKIDNLKKNTKILKLWGNGKSKREFLYVNDFTKALFQITFLSKKKFKQNSYESIINVPSKYEFSIKSLAHKIAKVLNKKIKIKYINKHLTGTKRKKMDSKRFSNIIKSFNQTGFDQSIKETFIAFKNAK